MLVSVGPARSLSERHEGVFKMTLAHRTDRLESARLVLRRIAPGDLPFFTRNHALPEVAQHLYPGGRPRSPEETAAWLQYTLASYEQLALGYLAVLCKEDRALIGRCGLMDLGRIRGTRARDSQRWFAREQAPAGGALTFECEPGYTFDPAVWGQGSRRSGALRSRLRRDGLQLSYAISAILPQRVGPARSTIANDCRDHPRGGSRRSKVHARGIGRH
jgi:RimJ/RimL family protein N-acetyltransferase